MKSITFIFFFLFYSSFILSQKKDNSFILTGKITPNYEGYIYFNYENKKDSCLVIDNHFVFKGILPKNQDYGSFSFKNKPSVMKNELYLENKSIQIELGFEEKKYKEYDVTFFEVKNVKGTTASIIQNDYNNFVLAHRLDKNWCQLLYKKLNEIITKYPANFYSSDLLLDASRNELLDKTELKKIYTKLNKQLQKEEAIKIIEANLYPENYIKINDTVFNFILPNANGIPFNTTALKGKYFLIDFWASWCSPCRQQLPDLKKVYEQYQNNNFEIVAVSIDKNKSKWVDVLNKEKLSWINLNENKDFLGAIVKKYNVDAIPSNFLVNPEGKIIDKDISPPELEIFLKENLKE